MSAYSSPFKAGILLFIRSFLHKTFIVLSIFSIIASIFVIVPPTKIAQAAEPTLEFAGSYGGSGPDWYYVEPYTVTIDSSGNLITGGYFEETIDFEPGAGTTILDTCEFCADLFIQKLDPDGNLIWVKQLASDTTGNWLDEISVDSAGNVYAAGVFTDNMDFDPGPGTAILNDTNGDTFVVKLDSDGDFVWAKQMDSNGLDVFDLESDSSNNLYVAGRFNGTLDTDLGVGVNNFTTPGSNDDGFIIKMDSAGDFVWSQQYGSTEGVNDRIRAIDINGDDDIILTGNFSGTVDFDRGAGTQTFVGSSNDTYVLKIDGDGTFAWVQGLFGVGSLVPWTLVVDSNDNVITSGRVFGDVDMDPGAGTNTFSGSNAPYILKLDTNGNYIWAATYGTSSPDGAKVDSQGAVYTYGNFNAISDVDPGAGTVNIDPADGETYLLKLTSDGEFEWVQQFTDGVSDTFTVEMDIAPNDDIYATGSFLGTGDFDPGAGTTNLTSLDENGSGDAYVFKLSSGPPSVTWTLTEDFKNNAVVGPDLELGTGDDGTDGDATTLDDVRSAGDEAALRALEYLSAKAGDYYTTAGLRSDGTMWTAGDVFNTVGDPQLDQLCQGAAQPFIDEMTQIGTDTDWVYFNAGFDTLHMIKSDGTLWGCGEADGGQLGDGTTDSKNVPTQIGTDTDWEGVWGADWHTIGKKTDGTLWAWGADWCGNLGQGTEDVQQNSPVQIGTDTDWDQVSAGDTHNLATKTDGTLWSWGCDYNPGELGLGNNPDYSIDVPTQVGTDTDWAVPAAGFMMSAAIKDDGTLWTFGQGGGFLGQGDAIERFVPTQVGTDTNWEDVSVGFFHMVAKKTNGTIWGWGENDDGELGQGATSAEVLSPVQIGSDNDWDTVSAGESYSLGLKDDGSFWVTGSDARWQVPTGVDGVDLLVMTEVYDPPYYTLGESSGYKVYAGAGNVADWTGLSWNTSSLPAGTEVRFRVRTSSDDVTYSAWSSYFTQDVDASTSGTADLTSISDAEYLDIEFSFTTTDVLVTPTLLDFTLDYDPLGGVATDEPTVTTAAASAITETTATLNGEITDIGSATPTERGFEYGLDNTYGTNVSDVGSFAAGVFNEPITGLTCNTLYHFRAFATSPDGTGNGSDTTFTTSACPVVPPGGGGSSSGSTTGGQNPTVPGQTPGTTPVPGTTPQPGTTPAPAPTPILSPCRVETNSAREAYRVAVAANTAAYNAAVLSARTIRDQTKVDARAAHVQANAQALTTLRAAQALDDQTRAAAGVLRTTTKAEVNTVYNASIKQAADTKKAADTQAETDYNNGVVAAKQRQTAGYADAESVYQASVAQSLSIYNQAYAAAGNNSTLRTQARNAYNAAVNAAKATRTATRSGVLATYNQTITDLKAQRTSVKAANKTAYDQAIATAKQIRTNGLAAADSAYNTTVTESRARRAAANTTYLAATVANRVTLNTALANADAVYRTAVADAAAVRAQSNAQALATRDARIAAICNPAPVPAPAPLPPAPTAPPSDQTETQDQDTNNGGGRGAGISDDNEETGTGLISIFEAILVDIRDLITETSNAIATTVRENPVAVATFSLTNLAVLTILHPQAIYSTSPGGLRAVSGASNLSLFYQRYAFNLFSFLGLRKKRRVWGTVYDSETKQPLDPAVVELIDASTGEVKERAITDLAGRFGFLTTTGKFVLRASKTNYSFPSKSRLSDKDEFYEHLYHGEEIEISEGSALVTPNIPMDPVAFDWNQEAKQGLIAKYSRLGYALHLVLTALFWAGLAYAIFSYTVLPDTKNLVLLVLYGLALLIRLLVGPKRLWGRLTQDGKPIAGARLELTEHIMGVIMGKANTASDGKFFLKTPQPGEYKLTIKSSPDGPVIFTKEVTVGKENVFTEDVLV